MKRTQRRLRLPLWLLRAAALFLSLAGWTRAAFAFQQREFITGLAAQPGVNYLLAGGVVWGLAGLLALWGLRARSRAQLALAGGAALVIALTYWADRLWVRQPEALPNGLFALGLTLVGLGYAGLVLWAAWLELKESSLEEA